METTRAQFFFESWRKDGVLLLAGGSKDKAFQDQKVLEHLSFLLKQAGEQYAEFDHVVSDFHEQGRRRREVKVIMRQKDLVHDYVEIMPGEDLRSFQWSLATDKQNGLKEFLTQRNRMLITVAEGNENEQLRALLETQLDSAGNSLLAIEVPIINLFKTGRARKKRVSTAFVYTVK